jgi:uncharacterized membrane protein YqhA
MLGVLLRLRYVLLFASLGAVFGALLMFGLGGVKLVGAGRAFLAAGEVDARTVTAAVMGATDALLFGIVLVIFAYAVAFGFVIDPDADIGRRMPGWMRVQGVSELKHTLVEVILVYLVVDFATDLAEESSHPTWQALVTPLSIVLIAAALRLLRHEPPARA